MKRQLSNTIYGLKFAIEKNDFERLKSSSEKKWNDFVANPIIFDLRMDFENIYISNDIEYRHIKNINLWRIILQIIQEIFLLLDEIYTKTR